jgi:hypothetical protein
MKIEDIKDNPCIIGKTSITVKNKETNKTIGVITNIINGTSAQARITSEWWTKYKLGAEGTRNIMRINGIDYYILNGKKLSFVEKYLLDNNTDGFYDNDIKAYNKQLEDAEKAKQAGLNILRLNIVA